MVKTKGGRKGDKEQERERRRKGGREEERKRGREGGYVEGKMGGREIKIMRRITVWVLLCVICPTYQFVLDLMWIRTHSHPLLTQAHLPFLECKDR